MELIPTRSMDRISDLTAVTSASLLEQSIEVEGKRSISLSFDPSQGKYSLIYTNFPFYIIFSFTM